MNEKRKEGSETENEYGREKVVKESDEEKEKRMDMYLSALELLLEVI